MLEKFYWYGFILADGYINHNNNCRCRLVLAEKDKNHLEKFNCFFDNNKISYQPTQKAYYTTTSLDENLVSLLDIKPRKTYNPPDTINYKSLSDAEFISLFLGLIDGDGNITNQVGRTDCKISIHCHSSWLNFYNYCCDRLSNICNLSFSKPRILKNGYMRWDISNHHIVNFLCKKTVEYNLPILERKWSRIDLSRKTKHEKADELFDKLVELRKTHTLKVISDMLNIPYNTICFHLYKSKRKHNGR